MILLAATIQREDSCWEQRIRCGKILKIFKNLIQYTSKSCLGSVIFQSRIRKNAIATAASKKACICVQCKNNWQSFYHIIGEFSSGCGIISSSMSTLLIYSSYEVFSVIL